MEQQPKEVGRARREGVIVGGANYGSGAVHYDNIDDPLMVVGVVGLK